MSSPVNQPDQPAQQVLRARVRQTVDDLLDAVGQRERARTARSSLVRGLARVGVGSGTSTGDYTEDWQRFLRLSSPPPFADVTGDARPARVAFVAPYGLFPPALRATAIIGNALRARGVEVAVLTCDRALPACEITCIVDYADTEEFLAADRPDPCKDCYASAKRSCAAFGLRELPLSLFTSGELRSRAHDIAEGLMDRTAEEIFAYRQDDLPLGKIAETSLYRFFLRGTLPDSEEVRGAGRRYLAAAIEMAGITERFIEAWKPDVILGHDGVYLIGGTSMAVAEAENVRRVTWDVGYRRGSFIGSHGASYVQELRTDERSTWDRRLTPDQERALSIYLHGRRYGAMDGSTYHPSPVEGREAVLAATGLQEGERLVSLFTNVTWDARVYADETLFAGPVEWVIETIRNVASTPGVRYVIRVHPAEVKNIAVPTQERMDDQLKAAFPELPDNVIVLPPEDDLSSYSLAAASEFVVVYSTQMGLETLAMGVPTVVAGDAPYSRKGIGVEPEDRETYYSLFADPSLAPRMVPEVLEKARRFAYYFFFQRMIILPDIINVAHTGLPRIRDLRDLEPGHYEGLDTVCDGILTGSPFETVDRASLNAVLSGASY